MDQLKSLLSSRRFENVITVLIVINAITLGLETIPEAVQYFGDLLTLFDRIILGVFVVEVSARLVAWRLDFFRDPWRIFDLVVVGVALVPATGGLSVLRALRILRVLRIISMVPSLKRVVGGLVSALPGMGSIMLLLTLVFYVFSVMATKLYGDSFPEWFGSIPASAGELVYGHCPSGDGSSSDGLGILHTVHRLHHIHRAQPFYRYHRVGHAGGTRCRGVRGP